MSGVDKLAASVGGRPLLAWTLDAVAAAPAVDRLVVVTASDRVDALRDAQPVGLEGARERFGRRISDEELRAAVDRMTKIALDTATSEHGH